MAASSSLPVSSSIVTSILNQFSADSAMDYFATLNEAILHDDIKAAAVLGWIAVGTHGLAELKSSESDTEQLADKLIKQLGKKQIEQWLTKDIILNLMAILRFGREGHLNIFNHLMNLGFTDDPKLSIAASSIIKCILSLSLLSKQPDADSPNLTNSLFLLKLEAARGLPIAQFITCEMLFSGKIEFFYPLHASLFPTTESWINCMSYNQKFVYDSFSFDQAVIFRKNRATIMGEHFHNHYLQIEDKLTKEKKIKECFFNVIDLYQSNPKEAYFYLRATAEEGNPNACYILSLLILRVNSYQTLRPTFAYQDKEKARGLIADALQEDSNVRQDLITNYVGLKSTAVAQRILQTCAESNFRHLKPENDPRKLRELRLPASSAYVLKFPTISMKLKLNGPAYHFATSSQTTTAEPAASAPKESKIKKSTPKKAVTLDEKQISAALTDSRIQSLGESTGLFSILAAQSQHGLDSNIIMAYLIYLTHFAEPKYAPGKRCNIFFNSELTSEYKIAHHILQTPDNQKRLNLFNNSESLLYARDQLFRHMDHVATKKNKHLTARERAAHKHALSIDVPITKTFIQENVDAYITKHASQQVMEAKPPMTLLKALRAVMKLSYQGEIIPDATSAEIKANLQNFAKSERSPYFWQFICKGFMKGQGEVFFSHLRRLDLFDILFPPTYGEEKRNSDLKLNHLAERIRYFDTFAAARRKAPAANWHLFTAVLIAKELKEDEPASQDAINVVVEAYKMPLVFLQQKGLKGSLFENKNDEYNKIYRERVSREKDRFLAAKATPELSYNR
jgi:TPR repeat protein